MSGANLLRACALMLALAACSGDSPVAVGTGQEVPRLTPPTAPITVAPATMILRSTSSSIHQTQMTNLRLDARDARGADLFPVVAWATSDASVVSVNSSDMIVSRITGIAVGTATITASVAGRSASIVITVLPALTGEGTLLVVESFRVIEFQYPSSPGHYYYAPEVRLRETANGAGAAITALDFAIPGFGPVPSCMTFRRVDPGAVLDLLPETYGDFAYAIYKPGERASGTEASMTLTVTDGLGIGRKLTATGPIVPGVLPTTYTGGSGLPTCVT